MSITEIASTGLLRVMALPGVVQDTEPHDWVARAAALAALQASAGVPGSKLELRSRTPDRPRRRAAGPAHGRSGSSAGADYRDRVRPHDHSAEDDGASTFDSLL